MTPDPAKSMFVTTDQFSESPTPSTQADSDFSLENVMAQIASSGGSKGETAAQLYQQLVDTMNTSAGALGKTHFTSGPHCDDPGAPINANGFPVQCPRTEGGLANFDPKAGTPVPFGTGNDGYHPVALVNRFDLAPKNGANCGQYRVVFGKNGASPSASRFLVIFEAVLPNPTPKAGLAACTPVAEFWDSLTTMATSAQREAALKNFYFKGLGKGFTPVITATNYGFGSTSNTGQIRFNMLSNDQWQLREIRLSQTCVGSSCDLTAEPTPVQNNPNGALFVAGGGAPGAAAFQKEFITQVKTLAAADVNHISMSTPITNDDSESNEQFTQGNLLLDDYVQASQGGGNSTLLANITAALPKGSTLTADNILDRATTQTCGGCHQVSPGRDIGGGLTWPASNGFTQIDEHGKESDALTKKFIPFRARVLQNFLLSQCSDGGVQVDLTDDGTTLGGSVIGSAN